MRQSAPFQYLSLVLPCGLDSGQVIEKDGERGRNRTYNLLIKSQLLCQLSYAPLRDFFAQTGCWLVRFGWVLGFRTFSILTNVFGLCNVPAGEGCSLQAGQYKCIWPA